MQTSWKSKLWFIFTIGSVSLCYLATLGPFVGGGDSGEFIVDAYILNVPHPPGYPIYTWLAHLFTLLPISTVAWRVGLFSACAQLAATVVLFKLVREWLKSDSLASLVTLCFSLSLLTWRMAIEAEVFALNNLFGVMWLWLCFRYETERRLRRRKFAG